MKMTNEARIGIMVSVVAILLGVLTVKTGKFNLTNDGSYVKVRFQNIDGVNLNSPVMYNGYEVGIVEAIDIIEMKDQTAMELTLWVNQGVRLRQGSKAYIKNLGFMGEKYVGLTSGDVGGMYLNPNTVVVGQEPPDFEQLLREGKEIAERLNSIAKNIDERLETNKEVLDSTLTNLDATMQDLSSVVSNVNERLTFNEQKIDDTVTNMHALSVNLEELSYDLKLNPWKIMYRGKDHKKKDARSAEDGNN